MRAQAIGGDLEFVGCDQVQLVLTRQVNTGDQGVVSALSQELDVSQNQVLACSGSVAAGCDLSLF